MSGHCPKSQDAFSETLLLIYGLGETVFLPTVFRNSTICVENLATGKTRATIKVGSQHFDKNLHIAIKDLSNPHAVKRVIVTAISNDGKAVINTSKPIRKGTIIIATLDNKIILTQLVSKIR